MTNIASFPKTMEEEQKEMFTKLAKQYKQFYDILEKEGFSSEQAYELMKQTLLIGASL